MWKETVRALQTGAAAEVAVVAFVIAFLCVVAYAFTMSKQTREHIKRQPLDDALEVFPETPPTPPAGASEPDDHD